MRRDIRDVSDDPIFMFNLNKVISGHRSPVAYFSSEIFWITDLEYFSFVVMEHPMWNFRNVRTPTDFQSVLLTYQKF